MWGRRARWAAVIMTAVVIGGVSWCGWRWWNVRRYRNAMARIEVAMQNGHYAVAGRDLRAIGPRRRPRPDRLPDRGLREGERTARTRTPSGPASLRTRNTAG